MGFVLGVSAGFTPGPLFALVISETLRFGLRAGIQVALAPLLSDLPIVVLSVVLIRSFAHSELFLGAISLAGGAFLLFVGFENFFCKDGAGPVLAKGVNSFAKAVVANALSPHPYLFWATVGAPLVITASKQNLAFSFLFLGSFYLWFIGSKITLALLTKRSKDFLSGKRYAYVLKVLGLALWGLAGSLIYSGFGRLALSFVL